MLAKNHITLATALTMGASLAFDEPFFLPFLAFVVLGALMPDIDHSDSEISQRFPLIGRFIKHRGPTHSLFGIAVFFGIFYLMLGVNKALSVVLIIFAAIGINYLNEVLCVRIKYIKSASQGLIRAKQIKGLVRVITIILTIFLGALVLLVWNEQFRYEIIFLLSFGFGAHILGDFLTKEGVKVFWPLKKRFGLRLFKTAGRIESLVGFLLIFVNIYFLYLFVYTFDASSLEYWHGYLNF